MSISRQEEIICALWTIAAICALGFGFQVVGIILSIKAFLDLLCCLKFAVKEAIEERKK